jgi:signal transduction histidine kinase
VVQLRAATGDEGAGVTVQVSDTGPGIPRELQPSLFTRPAFTGSVRSDGSGGGGLGLVFVQRILQLHGSDIRLVPQAGRGAVFRFRLSGA